jgi:hypothetical protein
MASKRRAYVHVGLDDARSEVVGRALDQHAGALLELGVKNPTRTREESLCAALALLGDAGSWGYDDRVAAEAWSALRRRATQGRDTIAWSQPRLARATPAQLARLAHDLAPLELHVVLTAHAPDPATAAAGATPGRDLGDVLDRVSTLVARPDRLHVVIGTSPVETWRAVGRVVGFGTASLRPAEPPSRPTRPLVGGSAAAARRLGERWAELVLAGDHDVVGDPEDLVPEVGSLDATGPEPAAQALLEAWTEIERLTVRNEALEHRLAVSKKKRKKLKARLAAVGESD